MLTDRQTVRLILIHVGHLTKDKLKFKPDKNENHSFPCCGYLHHIQIHIIQDHASRTQDLWKIHFSTFRHLCMDVITFISSCSKELFHLNQLNTSCNICSGRRVFRSGLLVLHMYYSTTNVDYYIHDFLNQLVIMKLRAATK